MSIRVPFIEAVNEPMLLKEHWSTLSFPQQAALLAAYGCPLDSRQKDHNGFTREDYFWAGQGYGKFDELGFLASVDRPRAYEPKEYREVWFIAGVRGGKSMLAATAMAYEAICGGHEAWIKKGGRAFIFQVAQDLRNAKKAINDIKVVLDTIPLLQQPYHGYGNYNGRRLDDPTADRINLWNGISIMTMPPTVKSVRGYDSPSAVLDEIGVWPTEKEAANVDAEIYDQISSRQAQFENPKIFGLSSPWVMGGLLFDRYKAGTEGKNLFCADCERLSAATRPPSCPQCAYVRRPMEGILVLHLPTAAMGNPLVKKQWLMTKRATNPSAFRRECLAEFQAAASAFIEPSLIDDAVSRGVRERTPIRRKEGEAPIPEPLYVAALDPGFKRDAFGFGIGHADEDGNVIIDLIRQWRPVNGIPVNAGQVLDEITPILKRYRIDYAISDQYNSPSIAQLAFDRGWMIEELTFTGHSKNQIFANLYSRFNLGKIKLVDDIDLIHELKNLQRLHTTDGNIKISAPAGLHDDLATIVALIAARCIWMAPIKQEHQPNQTHDDMIEKQIQRKKKYYDTGYDSW